VSSERASARSDGWLGAVGALSAHAGPFDSLTVGDCGRNRLFRL